MNIYRTRTIIKPQLVYFLPHFRRPFLCFQGVCFQKILCLCMTKGQKISKKNMLSWILPKLNTGAILCTENCPASVFWKNPGRHNLLLRFTDLQYSRVVSKQERVLMPRILQPSVLYMISAKRYIYLTVYCNLSVYWKG